MKLSDFQKKTDLDIAQDFVNALGSISIKAEPIRPYQLIAYDQSSPEQKSKLSKDQSFWMQNEIKEYLNLKDKYRSENQSNMYWLYWAYDNIGDVKDQNLLNKIHEFENFMLLKNQFNGDVKCRNIGVSSKTIKTEQADWDD